MISYCVEAKSRRDLREIAQSIKRILGIENMFKIPIVQLLDIFCDVFDNFSYEIVEDVYMEKGKHAETDVVTGHIKIKESIYIGACNGIGRDRMTIAHEIGHFITLCVYGFKLSRYFGKNIKMYNDPEWQAMCFAGEFMIDYDLTKNMTPKEVAKICGVSLEAAKYQAIHRDGKE